MKHLKRIMSMMIVVMLFLTMMPLQTFADSYKKLDVSDECGLVYVGNNYKADLKKGKTYLICLETAGYELKSADSSDTSILKITDLCNDDDLHSIDVTAKKEGTATITIEGYDPDEDVTETIKIKCTVKKGKAPKSTIKPTTWVYKNSKKVKIQATNVRKGDVIKVRIGKKTYTKKIKKASSKAKVTVKIKKPGFYGKKYKITLVRKGKTIASKSKYVYLGTTVYVGYSKKKVKWLRYWKDPDRINKSSRGEQWCYDWDGERAYLYFNNKGIVTDWQIFED